MSKPNTPPLPKTIKGINAVLALVGCEYRADIETSDHWIGLRVPEEQRKYKNYHHIACVAKAPKNPDPDDPHMNRTLQDTWDWFWQRHDLGHIEEIKEEWQEYVSNRSKTNQVKEK